MNTLALFAKYGRPGEVKTRLARTIGARPASELYECFLRTLLRRFARAGDRRTVVFWPPRQRAWFAALAGEAWQTVPQRAGDLGQRMRHFLDRTLGSPHDRVVLIGSDSPTLPQARVEEAFRLLEKYPVVLGPTSDGGYYLVGATGSVPPIFADVAWSTPAVWRQTVDHLERAGCPFARLPEWYDVDEMEDLQRLHAQLISLTRDDRGWMPLRDAVADALGDDGPCTTA